MVHELTSFIDGISYIISIIDDSSIDRNPLAPAPRIIAWSTTSFIAQSVNSKLTPSNLNSFLYCFINAFFGSVKIL